MKIAVALSLLLALGACSACDTYGIDCSNSPTSAIASERAPDPNTCDFNLLAADTSIILSALWVECRTGQIIHAPLGDEDLCNPFLNMSQGIGGSVYCTLDSRAAVQKRLATKEYLRQHGSQ